MVSKLTVYLKSGNKVVIDLEDEAKAQAPEALAMALFKAINFTTDSKTLRLQNAVFQFLEIEALVYE